MLDYSELSLGKLEHKISRLMGQCIEEWDLIQDGDRIMVAVSGGKDSYTLLDLLLRQQRVAPIQFSLVAFHLDQGQPGFPTERVREYLASQQVEFVIHRQDTYRIVVDKVKPGKTTCGLCSRLRRGIIYNEAVKLGCHKIALGHHLDDAIETLLMNIFYSGQLKGMPAKLYSDDQRNIVIRPLLSVPEAMIRAYAERMAFPAVPCNLCANQTRMKRDAMTQLLDTLEMDNPKVRGNAFAALHRVVATHLLDQQVLARLGDPLVGGGGAADKDVFEALMARNDALDGDAALE